MSVTIKCLSLWQPWATLMAIGAKRIETRSWGTRYRGWVAIHAAKHWSGELRDMCAQQPFLSALGRIDLMFRPLDRRPGVYSRQLPDGSHQSFHLGEIIALVHLIDCVACTAANCPDDSEACFGDYTPGRFQWRTDRVINLGDAAIVASGQRGLFTLQLDIELRLLRRIDAFESEAAR